jgi:GAF domain-containing protein
VKIAPLPHNEKARIEALHSLGISATTTEKRFDTITKEATRLLSVPIAIISLVYEDKEIYKSCIGLEEKEGGRAVSFCGHALLAKEMFIVEDTLLDERFKDNPMVIGKPFIRSYAGIVLREHATNQPIGVLCVKDTEPRQFGPQDIANLLELAKKAEKELNTKPKKSLQ